MTQAFKMAAYAMAITEEQKTLLIILFFLFL